jgi:hypothetical protein
MSSPQDPQERFAGEPPPGTRDTGSDVPSGGEDRPSGAIAGDESVPSHGSGGEDPGFNTRFTNEPPRDVESAVPPYEGRQTTAKPADGGDEGGARTAGAVKPVADTDYKAPAPGQTQGGTTASPAEEQPASGQPETDTGDDRVGPSHVPGAGRGEDKR